MTRPADPAAPLVLAVTGASGAPYGIRLLEQLLVAGRPVQLIVSSHGFRLLRTESEVGDLAGLRAAVGAERGLPLRAPPLALCTDNAAMIAWAGVERLARGESDALDAPARPRWPLDPRAA